MLDFYIDSANFNELDQAYKTGVFKGITTNPSLIKKENRPRFEVLKDISRLLPEVMVIQIVGSTYDERLSDFHRVLQFCQFHGIQFSPKVAVDMIGLNLIAHLVGAHPDLEITGSAIYSADQGVLAASLGCHYLDINYGGMLTEKIDVKHELQSLLNFIEKNGYEAQIVCGSFHSSDQVLQAIEAGAHGVSLSYQVFESMVNKKCALHAIDAYNNDSRE